MFITRHAKERAKERLGWNGKTLSRMAEKAFHTGLCVNDLRGDLRLFVSGLIGAGYEQDCQIRIMGNCVYVFKSHTSLCTVYKLNKDHQKLLKK